MKNKVLGSVLGAALLAGSTVAVADDMFAAENFSATLTFTTDYTYRGASLSNGDAAIQGSFDWGNGPWFAGMWGSSWTSGTSENLEIDYYFGWADAVGGVDLMVMPIWYTYPGSDDRDGVLDDATFELWTSAGIALTDSVYGTIGLDYADEWFEGEDSLHMYVNLSTTIGGFGVDATYGNFDIDDAADDYSYYNIGVSTEAAGFGLDLRYHDSSDEDEIAAAVGPALDGVVLSVSRSF